VHSAELSAHLPAFPGKAAAGWGGAVRGWLQPLTGGGLAAWGAPVGRGPGGRTGGGRWQLAPGPIFHAEQGRVQGGAASVRISRVAGEAGGRRPCGDGAVTVQSPCRERRSREAKGCGWIQIPWSRPRLHPTIRLHLTGQLRSCFFLRETCGSMGQGTMD